MSENIGIKIMTIDALEFPMTGENYNAKDTKYGVKNMEL